MIGASIFLKAIQNGTITNDQGFAELRNIPTGRQTIIIKSFEFKENKEIFYSFKKLMLPLSPSDTILDASAALAAADIAALRNDGII